MPQLRDERVDHATGIVNCSVGAYQSFTQMLHSLDRLEGTSNGPGSSATQPHSHTHAFARFIEARATAPQVKIL